MLYLAFFFCLFLIAQTTAIFLWYRIAIRPLPKIFEQMVMSALTSQELRQIVSGKAEVVRANVLALEKERWDALVRHSALKGRRKLTTTEKAEREALLKALNDLDTQIRNVDIAVKSIYGDSMLETVKNLERMKIVAVINRYLDGKGMM